MANSEYVQSLSHEKPNIEYNDDPKNESLTYLMNKFGNGPPNVLTMASIHDPSSRFAFPSNVWRILQNDQKIDFEFVPELVDTTLSHIETKDFESKMTKQPFLLNHVSHDGLIMFSCFHAASHLLRHCSSKNEADIHTGSASQTGTSLSKECSPWTLVLLHSIMASEDMWNNRVNKNRDTNDEFGWNVRIRSRPSSVMPYTHLGMTTNEVWEHEHKNIPKDSPLRKPFAEIRRLSLLWAESRLLVGTSPDSDVTEKMWIPLDTYHVDSYMRILDNELRSNFKEKDVHLHLRNVYDTICLDVSGLQFKSYHNCLNQHDITRRTESDRKEFLSYQEPREGRQQVYGGLPVVGDFVPHVSSCSIDPCASDSMRMYNRFGDIRRVVLGESVQSMKDDHLLQDMFFETPESGKKSVHQNVVASRFMAYMRLHTILSIACAGEDGKMNIDKVRDCLCHILSNKSLSNQGDARSKKSALYIGSIANETYTHLFATKTLMELLYSSSALTSSTIHKLAEPFFRACKFFEALRYENEQSIILNETFLEVGGNRSKDEFFRQMLLVREKQIQKLKYIIEQIAHQTNALTDTAESVTMKISQSRGVSTYDKINEIVESSSDNRRMVLETLLNSVMVLEKDDDSTDIRHLIHSSTEANLAADMLIAIRGGFTDEEVQNIFENRTSRQQMGVINLLQQVTSTQKIKRNNNSKRGEPTQPTPMASTLVATGDISPDARLIVQRYYDTANGNDSTVDEFVSKFPSSTDSAKLEALRFIKAIQRQKTMPGK